MLKGIFGCLQKMIRFPRSDQPLQSLPRSPASWKKCGKTRRDRHQMITGRLWRTHRRDARQGRLWRAGGERSAQSSPLAPPPGQWSRATAPVLAGRTGLPWRPSGRVPRVSVPLGSVAVAAIVRGSFAVDSIVRGLFVRGSLPHRAPARGLRPLAVLGEADLVEEEADHADEPDADQHGGRGPAGAARDERAAGHAHERNGERAAVAPCSGPPAHRITCGRRGRRCQTTTGCPRGRARSTPASRSPCPAVRARSWRRRRGQ